MAQSLYSFGVRALCRFTTRVNVLWPRVTSDGMKSLFLLCFDCRMAREIMLSKWDSLFAFCITSSGVPTSAREVQTGPHSQQMPPVGMRSFGPSYDEGR